MPKNLKLLRLLASQSKSTPSALKKRSRYRSLFMYPLKVLQSLPQRQPLFRVGLLTALVYHKKEKRKRGERWLVFFVLGVV